MSKFCKNCGAELKEGSDVCPYCGRNNGVETYNNDPIINYDQTNNGTYTENHQNNNVINNANQNVNSKFNTMAIIAFVCSIIGLGCCGIILGIVSIVMRNNFT